MKSLYREIIEHLEERLENVKVNKHYNEGVLKNNRGAAHYALADAIGHIKAIKGLRDHKKKKPHRQKGMI